MKEPTNPCVPWQRSPVLSTESPAEYEALREQFFREIEPCGFIERNYAEDFLHFNWDIRRLRRAKTAIIDSVRVVALKELLVLGKGEMYGSHKSEQDLAVGYFNGEATREEVIALLKSRGLDETAIETEAIRIRLDELAKLEAMIASLETRRDKALLKISDYRAYVGETLKTAGSRVIEAGSSAVAELEHVRVAAD